MRRAEERQKLRIPFGMQTFQRHETQGRGVNRITPPSGGRAIVEDVTKMGITSHRANFDALHLERVVRLFHNHIGTDRFGEAGTAQLAIEFVERGKERFACNEIDVEAGAEIIPILILKRSLAPVLAHDVVLGIA